MSLDPRFKTVGDFEAESPLDRQIQQLEDNAKAAFQRVATLALARLVPTQKKTADYIAKLGELVVTSGELAVRLPVATPQNAGEPAGVLVLEGPVTVATVSSDVQGDDADVLEDVGLYLYFSDGVGWWRFGGVTSVTVGPGLTGGGTGAVDIGIDDDVVITSSVLDTELQPLRLSVEKLRLILFALVRVEMGGQPENGWEGLNA